MGHFAKFSASIPALKFHVTHMSVFGSTHSVMHARVQIFVHAPGLVHDQSAPIAQQLNPCRLQQLGHTDELIVKHIGM